MTCARGILMFLAMAGPAMADQNCGDHDAVLSALERHYGETVQARAVQTNGTMMELTANLATGTWTAVITDAAGRSCGAAAGEKFTLTKPGDPA